MEQSPPNKQKYCCCGLVFFLLLLVLSHASRADEIIVNASVGSPEISNETLKSIFGLRLRTWPDGSPITVYVLADKNPLHDRFCKRVLNVFPHQMRRAWDRLVLSGTGQAPIEVASETEMHNKVASTPGAIGYVGKTTANKQIRTLLIY